MKNKRKNIIISEYTGKEVIYAFDHYHLLLQKKFIHLNLEEDDKTQGFSNKNDKEVSHEKLSD